MKNYEKGEEKGEEKKLVSGRNGDVNRTGGSSNGKQTVNNRSVASQTGIEHLERTCNCRTLRRVVREKGRKRCKFCGCCRQHPFFFAALFLIFVVFVATIVFIIVMFFAIGAKFDRIHSHLNGRNGLKDSIKKLTTYVNNLNTNKN